MSDIPDTLYRADWLPNHTMAEINIWRGPSTEYTRTALTILRNDLKIAALVEVAKRQADNMAFLLNHASMSNGLYNKFTRELEEDRAAIAAWEGK